MRRGDRPDAHRIAESHASALPDGDRSALRGTFIHPVPLPGLRRHRVAGVVETTRVPAGRGPMARRTAASMADAGTEDAVDPLDLRPRLAWLIALHSLRDGPVSLARNGPNPAPPPIFTRRASNGMIV